MVTAYQSVCMENYIYHGIVCHQTFVIRDFYSLNISSAITKLSRLIEDAYSNAQGQIIDLSNNEILVSFAFSSG